MYVCDKVIDSINVLQVAYHNLDNQYDMPVIIMNDCLLTRVSTN